MAREALVIGQAEDANGENWDVRERRPTLHGFDVMVGWPQGERRGKGGRGVAVIPTVALAQYLTETRLRDIDLPIGLTTVKRLRRELGLRWDWDRWWADRENDLRTMTLQSFADKHGCSVGAASQRRAMLDDRS